MKRKIIKYLNLKDRTQYSKIDFIFEDYISGRLKQLFIEKGFKNVEIFYDIHRNKGCCLYVDCKYHNLNINLIFDENKYFQSVYVSYCSIKELEAGETQFQYPEDFTIENFLNDFCVSLNNNANLKNI